MTPIELPNSLHQLIAQSISLSASGNLEEALACINTALAMQPDFFPLLLNKGQLLSQLARFEAAADCFDQLLIFRPAFQEAATLRNQALNALLEQLKSNRPDHRHTVSAAFYFRQGNTLLQLARYTEALSCLNQCLAIEQNHIEALNARGNVLLALDRHEEALSSYAQILSLLPGNTAAEFNYANVLQKLGRLNEALTYYEHVAATPGDFAEATMEQSHCRLIQGDFERGWPQYESRWQTQQLQAHFLHSHAPLWQGQFSLTDRTILLWAEQGLGDTIQFVRYTALVVKEAASVILRVPVILRVLMASLPLEVTIISDQEPLPEHNAHCPLLTLPLAFNTTLASIPAAIPYLSADAPSISKWQSILGKHQKMRVGLVWAGRQYGLVNHTRDMQLADLQMLLSLANTKGIEFISLQKAIPQADQSTLADMPQLICLGESLQDFSDTAAVIEQLDLLISIDSAVAHLAGALGKPVWLMLRQSSEWRWLKNRNDSPWYPLHKIFRQMQRGDWQQVVESIYANLRISN